MIINGNLKLRGSGIESLGNIKKIKGNLDLMDSKIKFLPNKLEILGFCDLENTPLVELPENLKIGEEIFLKGSGITKKYILEQRPDLIKQCDWLF